MDVDPESKGVTSSPPSMDINHDDDAPPQLCTSSSLSPARGKVVVEDETPKHANKVKSRSGPSTKDVRTDYTQVSLVRVFTIQHLQFFHFSNASRYYRPIFIRRLIILVMVIRHNMDIIIHLLRIMVDTTIHMFHHRHHNHPLVIILYNRRIIITFISIVEAMEHTLIIHHLLPSMHPLIMEVLEEEMQALDITPTHRRYSRRYPRLLQIPTMKIREEMFVQKSHHLVEASVVQIR